MNHSPSNPKGKMPRNKSTSKGSLPKLSQILRGNHTPQLLEKKKNKNRSRGGEGLMIQGQSKIIE